MVVESGVIRDPDQPFGEALLPGESPLAGAGSLAAAAVAYSRRIAATRRSEQGHTSKSAESEASAAQGAGDGAQRDTGASTSDGSGAGDGAGAASWSDSAGRAGAGVVAGGEGDSVVRLLTNRAVVLATLGRWDESLQDAAAALKLNPTYPLVSVRLCHRVCCSVADVPTTTPP